MSDALDDWEQADEDEIQAPVVVIKPAKKTSAKGTKTAAIVGNTGAVGVASPIILQKRNDRKSDLDQDELLKRDDTVNQDSRSLHEKNRALWDRANSYEQPIISRSDNNNMRTEYVPEIKILRRPKSPVQAVKATHTKSKPLAQREADYNAAREKIFGPSSSSSPSSSTSSALTKNTNNNASAAANPSSNSRSGSGSSSPSGSGSPMDLKPIAFKGVPPTIRLAQRPSSSPSSPLSSGSGQDYTAIRQPQGPTNVPNAQNPQARRGGRGEARQEGGSIGFRKPRRGAPRPPPTS
ncbi:hypothetical protein EDD21DRAFT_440157 [Dissophora ornata]|nr:hypothetical protein EDD21DRAFT_440157 [Dissophora ornata]